MAAFRAYVYRQVDGLVVGKEYCNHRDGMMRSVMASGNLVPYQRLNMARHEGSLLSEKEPLCCPCSLRKMNLSVL